MRTELEIAIFILILQFFVISNSICQVNLVINGDFENFLTNNGEIIINEQIVNGSDKDTLNQYKLSESIREWKISLLSWNDETNGHRFNCNGIYSLENSQRGNIYTIISPFKKSTNNSYRISNLTGELCKPLIKGRKYKLSFWLKFDNGNTQADEINVHFSENRINPIGKIDIETKRKKIIAKNTTGDRLEVPNITFKTNHNKTSYYKLEQIGVPHHTGH